MPRYKVKVNTNNVDHWSIESDVVTDPVMIQAPSGSTVVPTEAEIEANETITVKGMDAAHNILATDTADHTNSPLSMPIAEGLGSETPAAGFWRAQQVTYDSMLNNDKTMRSSDYYMTGKNAPYLDATAYDMAVSRDGKRIALGCPMYPGAPSNLRFTDVYGTAGNGFPYDKGAGGGVVTSDLAINVNITGLETGGVNSSIISSSEPYFTSDMVNLIVKSNDGGRAKITSYYNTTTVQVYYFEYFANTNYSSGSLFLENTTSNNTLPERQSVRTMNVPSQHKIKTTVTPATAQDYFYDSQYLTASERTNSSGNPYGANQSNHYVTQFFNNSPFFNYNERIEYYDQSNWLYRQGYEEEFNQRVTADDSWKIRFGDYTEQQFYNQGVQTPYVPPANLPVFGHDGKVAPGRVLILNEVNSNWESVGQIVGPFNRHEFGESVALSANGNTLVVGASGNGGPGWDRVNLNGFYHSNTQHRSAEMNSSAASDTSWYGTRFTFERPAGTASGSEPRNFYKVYRNVPDFNNAVAGYDQNVSNPFTQPTTDQAGFSLFQDGEVAGDEIHDPNVGVWKGHIGFLESTTTIPVGSSWAEEYMGTNNSARVRVYQTSDNGVTWTQKGSDIHGSGSYEKLTSTQSFLIVGYQFPNGFTWDGATEFEGETSDRFGRIVDISDDGNTIIAAATQKVRGTTNDKYWSGAVRVWKYEYNDWVPKSDWIVPPNSFNLHSISMSSDGSRFAVGSTGRWGNNYGFGHGQGIYQGELHSRFFENITDGGYVHCYEQQGNNYVAYGSPVEGQYNGDGFGFDVSMSEDGTAFAAASPFGNYLISGTRRIIDQDMGGATAEDSIYKFRHLFYEQFPGKTAYQDPEWYNEFVPRYDIAPIPTTPLGQENDELVRRPDRADFTDMVAGRLAAAPNPLLGNYSFPTTTDGEVIYDSAEKFYQWRRPQYNGTGEILVYEMIDSDWQQRGILKPPTTVVTRHLPSYGYRQQMAYEYPGFGTGLFPLTVDSQYQDTVANQIGLKPSVFTIYQEDPSTRPYNSTFTDRVSTYDGNIIETQTERSQTFGWGMFGLSLHKDDAGHLHVTFPVMNSGTNEEKNLSTDYWYGQDSSGNFVRLEKVTELNKYGIELTKYGPVDLNAFAAANQNTFRGGVLTYSNTTGMWVRSAQSEDITFAADPSDTSVGIVTPSNAVTTQMHKPHVVMAHAFGSSGPQGSDLSNWIDQYGVDIQRANNNISLTGIYLTGDDQRYPAVRWGAIESPKINHIFGFNHGDRSTVEQRCGFNSPSCKVDDFPDVENGRRMVCRGSIAVLGPPWTGFKKGGVSFREDSRALSPQLWRMNGANMGNHFYHRERDEVGCLKEGGGIIVLKATS